MSKLPLEIVTVFGTSKGWFRTEKDALDSRSTVWQAYHPRYGNKEDIKTGPALYDPTSDCYFALTPLHVK
jgi:hypothetical protein